jgi:hypothetical protein
MAFPKQADEAAELRLSYVPSELWVASFNATPNHGDMEAKASIPEDG